MTEAEWLAAADPEAVAERVWHTASERQIRLIACGCCRLAWNWLIDKRSCGAVEVSERFADGFAGSDELGRAAYYAEAAAFAIHAKQESYDREQRAIRGGWVNAENAAEEGVLRARDGTPISFDVARLAAECAEYSASAPSWILQQRPELIFSLAVVRDIVGNPFRPGVFDPAWQTSHAVLLAKGIYDDRAFDRMPILADALQDAGCDSDDVLSHCRDPQQVHVRGCWVVDFVLGRK